MLKLKMKLFDFAMPLILATQILAVQSQLVIRLFTQTSPLVASSINATTTLPTIPGYCTLSSCQNYVLTHGFNSNGVADWIIAMKNKLLAIDNTSNVFVVDWGVGANTGLNYNQAIRNLGQYVSLAYEVVSSLRNDINIENNLLNIYCIGHSLGSHFCGLLSQLFISRLNMKFEKITALDPAGPCFESAPESDRLSINDAEYVEAIHTSDELGYDPSIGHSDFYVNGGEKQPGCDDQSILDLFTFKSIGKLDIFDTGLCASPNVKSVNTAVRTNPLTITCSHGRAYDYFTESISKDPSACMFTQYQCSSYSNFLRGRCNNCTSNVMGFNSVKPPNGSVRYYGRTNQMSLFCNTAVPDLSTSDNFYCNSSRSLTGTLGVLVSFILVNILLNFFS